MIKKLNFEVLFFIIIFLIFLIFFSFVCPLVLYNADDWANLSGMRAAYPIWGGWNPIKVLPETIMPFCGYVSAYLINPIINDYVMSITICSAIIFAVLITIYFYVLFKLLKERYELSISHNINIIIIFIFLHFAIFKTNEYSTYMFYANNLTCYFHYLMPALINSILVLYLLLIKEFLNKSVIFKNGLVILWFYLAIFSNIFHSIILISFISVALLYSFFQNIKYQNIVVNDLKNFVSKNAAWFLIIIVWLISLLFEANGGRADSIGRSILELPVKETINILIHLLKQISDGFLVLFFTSLFISAFIYLTKKSKTEKDFYYKNTVLKLFFSSLITITFIVLVSAKTQIPGIYIGSSQVVFSFLFYIFVILLFSIGYILKNLPKLLSILPILCFVIFAYTFNADRHLFSGDMGGLSRYQCVLVDNYFIEQVVSADKAGEDEMELVVPKGINNANWPHPSFLGPAISRTLYTHGIISRNLKVEIKVDENLNKKFHLNY